MFSSFIMYQSRICYQMDYCILRGLIPLSTQIQLNICKGCQQKGILFCLDSNYHLFIYRALTVCVHHFRHVPFDKRKALASYSLLRVPSPVGTEVPLSQKARTRVVGAKVALRNLLCCLSSGYYPTEWSLEGCCEYLRGKWMVPVTSTHGKHRKKWKPVDVIIRSATEQPTPSHTCSAAGFVSTLLSPAFEPLAMSP